MKINLQQLIAILPLLIIGLTVIVIMLSVAWQRNHFLNAVFSLFGLSSALASLWFINNTSYIEVTHLMCVDNYAILYSALVILAGTVTCIFAYSWLEDNTENKEEFYLLVLISVIGGILLSSSNNFISLFLGIELVSLPLFGLIGYLSQHKYSLEASIKYMTLSTVASSFLLFGIAMLYAQYGDLSFANFSKIQSNNIIFKKPLILAGLSLMLVGFSFKLSLVPFHLWTPDVYQGAPLPVSMFLATVNKIAVFSAMIRMFLYIPSNIIKPIQIILIIIAFLSIFFGNLMALNQVNIKRLLGYSSISHLGYLLISLVSIKIENISIEAVNIYLIGYLFSNIGVFGIISLVSNSSWNLDTLFSYRGLFWQNPILSVAMTVMMFSLAGIPMTIGFIGKLYLIITSLKAKLWWLTIAIVVGSIIGLCYYLRVIANMYFLVSPSKNNLNLPYNWYCTPRGIIILISTAIVLIFGVYPQPIINIVQFTMPAL